ncbi:MAG: ATP-binding protein, partial [bacterium]
MEKQILNEFNKRTQLVLSEFQDHFFIIEQTVRNALANFYTKLDSANISRIKNLKHTYPLIEDLFILEPAGGIQFLTANLLYSQQTRNQIYTIKKYPPSIMNLAKQGQQFELQRNDYVQALKFYQRAFDKTSKIENKGELLNAMARVYKKTIRYEEAIDTYKRILLDFSSQHSGSGIPLGAAAHLELGTLFLSRSDSAFAIQTLLNLFQKLLKGYWRLDKTQYDFFSQQVTESLNNIFSQSTITSDFVPYKDTFKKLIEQEKEQKSFTDRLLTFQENAGAVLLDQYDELREDFKNNQHTIKINNQEFLVSLLNKPTGNGNGDKTNWGILWRENIINSGLLPSIIKHHIKSNNIYWQIVNSDGQLKSNSSHELKGTQIVNIGFLNNFPNWSLEIYQQDPQFFDYVLSSGRSVYFYIFFLIAGILVFGFTITVRSVRHELELAKLKSDFVSTVSHEFKSPLTSIRQLSEMLHRGRVPSKERRQKYYEVIAEQSEKLSLLIDNVLDFSKMEAGKKRFEFEFVDAGSLLRDLISTIQHRVRYEGFEIQTDIAQSLPEIKIDRLALTQAISNLVDNAIKYSGDSKKIQISSSVENNHLKISVKDYGVGIHKKNLNKLFQRFYRGEDELTRSKKGTGLGLTLAKQIVDTHKGTIHVESELGKGSTFT